MVRTHADQLIKDIDELSNQIEGGTGSLKGIRNLSQSDLDTLAMYAACIYCNGTWECHLMQPLGSVEKVLKAYKVF